MNTMQQPVSSVAERHVEFKYIYCKKMLVPFNGRNLYTMPLSTDNMVHT